MLSCTQVGRHTYRAYVLGYVYLKNSNEWAFPENNETFSLANIFPIMQKDYNFCIMAFKIV